MFDVIGGARSVLILTHHNPDPDAIAAAFGLRHLLKNTGKYRSAIGYSGMIGRAENRAMNRLLRINPKPVSKLKSRKFDRIILCDSQPTGKNATIYNGRVADIVLDHHPKKRRKIQSAFTDIRTEYGSTSTIVVEYLRQLNISLDARVATALYFGIKTDISDIARHKNEADLRAMRYLFPQTSVRWLYRIENPRLPADYFLVNANAIRNSKVYKDAIVSDLGTIPLPDYVAELADYLLKLEGMRWSFCIGCNNGRIYYSIRTLSRKKDAGNIAARLARNRKGGSGGGHRRSAAGFIDISSIAPEKRQQSCHSLIQSFLKMISHENVACKSIDGQDMESPGEISGDRENLNDQAEGSSNSSPK